VEELNQFVGKELSSVNEQITDIASKSGLTVQPWPKGVGIVAGEPKTLLVVVNNTEENIIDQFIAYEP